MATNKRHTVLECEVAVTLKTAAGIKVTGRRDAESSLSKVKIKWDGRGAFFFLFSGCDDDLANPIWLAGAPPIKQEISVKRRWFVSARSDHTILGAHQVLLPVVSGPGRTRQERP